MKIAICSSEVVPFAKTGGLADVSGALPLALEQLKHEVIIVMPKYNCVANAGIPIKAAVPGYSCATIGKNVKVYFVEHAEYYSRPGLYGEKDGDYKDNLSRFAFYSKQAMELFKKINFCPDVIHCNDWQSALLPVFLKTTYANDAFFKKTKSILTIHNLAYQGLFAREEFSKLGLPESLFGMNGFEFYGKVNFLKAGIIFSDFVTTVSDGYAKEILTKEFGCGLEGVLKTREKSLVGIINGLDYAAWDSSKDKKLFATYNEEDLSGKKENKKKLQKLCGLKVDEAIPLIGFVGRLAEQKGIDLIAKLVNDLDKLKAQVVILGTGDAKYHTLLEQSAKKNPQGFSLHLKFDDGLARQIYAASDMFLMPSRFEPCGLGQMISFKYGTVPVVNKTGGLADTVFDVDTSKKDGNGFVFTQFTYEAFRDTIARAIKLFAKTRSWTTLVKKVMALNFSWESSAKKYVALYKKAVAG